MPLSTFLKLLRKEKINAIIWANDYSFDYSFVKLPVFDEDSFQIQKSEVIEYPELFFIG